MTASIIKVYDRAGFMLTEFEASTEREWLIGEYGEATFTLARTDPHCRRMFLEYGNRILIQSNADDPAGVDLPDWGGVIHTPRTWGDHDVTVTARSGEFLVAFRRGPVSMTHVDTFGGMFRRCLPYLNKPEDLYIREGEIYDGGKAIERTLELHEMYDAIVDMAEDAGHEWSIESAIDNAGRLYFLANWYEKRGVACDYGLEEGVNLTAGSQFTEQDDIANDVLAYSSQMDGWNINHVRTAKDADSIARYGLRQSTLSVSCNGGDTAAVLAAAKAELARKKNPRATFELEVTSDLTAGLDAVGQIRLGNSYPLSLSTIGFYNENEFGYAGRVRVIGMNWSDSDQTLRLNCEEVEDGAAI